MCARSQSFPDLEVLDATMVRRGSPPRSPAKPNALTPRYRTQCPGRAAIQPPRPSNFPRKAPRTPPALLILLLAARATLCMHALLHTPSSPPPQSTTLPTAQLNTAAHNPPPTPAANTPNAAILNPRGRLLHFRPLHPAPRTHGRARRFAWLHLHIWLGEHHRRTPPTPTPTRIRGDASAPTSNASHLTPQHASTPDQTPHTQSPTENQTTNQTKNQTIPRLAGGTWSYQSRGGRKPAIAARHH